MASNSKIDYQLLCIVWSILFSMAQPKEIADGPKARVRTYLHSDLPSNNTVTVIDPPHKGNNRAGMIQVLDAPLYDGPEPNATKVGRLVGVTASVGDASNIGLIWIMNHVYNDGPNKGSSLTVVGLGFPASEVRELPVVGGTGRFRMARGYELSKTFKYRVCEDTLETRFEFEHNVY